MSHSHLNLSLVVSSMIKSLFLFTLICLLSPHISKGLDKILAASNWDSFGDSGATINNGLFEFPTDALSWAGFWYSESSILPFTFPSGGKITFTASIPSGESADVRFRFEKAPHPDVDPAHDTASVTISGGTDAQYTIDIPSQGSNEFRSFVMYINDRDIPINMGTIIVTEYSDSNDNVDFLTPNNITSYFGDFSFGEDLNTGNSIQWKQEIVYNPYNNEIQDYVNGKVGYDDNNHLVLRIDRTGPNTYYSSRVNSSIYNGIKVGSWAPTVASSASFFANLRAVSGSCVRGFSPLGYFC